MCRAPTIHRNITMKGNRSSDQLNTDIGNRPHPRSASASMRSTTDPRGHRFECETALVVGLGQSANVAIVRV